MIRLGVNTMVWSGGYDGRQIELCERIRGWGYQVMELPVFDFDAVDPAPVRRALAAAGLRLTVTSAMPPGLSMISADAAVRRRARGWLVHAARKTAEMGGTILAGPMYHPVGDLPGRRRTAAEWDYAVAGYRALAHAAESSGARIAIEPLNRFEAYFLNTAADARRLCDEIGSDAVGVLYDTFHANIEERDIVGALGTLGPRLMHVHLSENDRGIPGTGHVPFGPLADALARMNYDGCAVVESFAGSIPELARSTAMWRDYAESPDEFARRAIENLRPFFPETES
jgi:D-psicose/D-tagatose/L-ribulose 3-epimerase